jgi:hypothetical protein
MPARIVRALTDSTMESQGADGKKLRVQWKKGEVKFFPQERSAVGNVGTTDASFFITTIN